MEMSADFKAMLASLVAVLIGLFNLIGLDNLAHNLEGYINNLPEQE